MKVMSGRDEGILELIKLLGLPKNCFSFCLKADIDSIVSVECGYYPEPIKINENNKLVEEFKKYKLVEIKENEENK